MEQDTFGPHTKKIAYWLFTTAAFVFAMIVIGAITRLTESGLSMVEWRPLIGAIPPLNEAEWNRVFEIYKQTPEYQQKNFWMGLEDFKHIFFWEWFHRFWGRIIGLVYALPFIFFLIKGLIPQGYKLKLFGLLLLGGAQAVMGWYMVESGLVDNPAVSHYRLAAHLSLAFIILALLVWFGLRFLNLPVQPDKALRTHLAMTSIVLAITVVWGAYVAGLDAGLVYNEFPGMGGSIIPSEWGKSASLSAFIFEDPVGVQFVHRWLGILTALVFFVFLFRAIKRGHAHSGIPALGIMICLQVGLGIATLLSNVALPVAVLHQAGAALLIMICTYNLYVLSPASEGASEPVDSATRSL